MTFSTNQARHLYVVKDVATVTGTTPAGTIEVAADAAKTHLYFKYNSPGGQVRSDLIDIKNVISAKSIDGVSQRRALKQVKVALDANYLKDGNALAGQDYILRIVINQFAGMSDTDQYFKYGMVKASANMTPEAFYRKLVESLNQNFSREITKLLDIKLDETKASKALASNTDITVSAVAAGTEGNGVSLEVKVDTAAVAPVVTGKVVVLTLATATATLGALKAAIAGVPAAAAIVSVAGKNATIEDSTAVIAAAATVTEGGETTGVLLTEALQDWKLGVLAQVPVYFEAQPTVITSGGEEVIWGTATASASATYVTNGKNIADLEYFCMGERGDQYRNVGFPYVIDTTYLVDPTVEYSSLNIHYAYVGSGEGVQKSERDITLVGSKTDINTIAASIGTKAGITIDALA